MAQTVDEILAGAKKTLAEANSKFPSASPQPSYSAARQERKTPNMADEMKAKADMVQKAKTALNN